MITDEALAKLKTENVDLVKFDGTIESAKAIVAFAGLPETAIVLGDDGPTSIHVEVDTHRQERTPATLLPGQVLVRMVDRFFGIIDTDGFVFDPKVEMLARMWMTCDPNRLGVHDADEIQGVSAAFSSLGPSHFWVTDNTGKPHWNWFVPRAEATLRFLDEQGFEIVPKGAPPSSRAEEIESKPQITRTAFERVQEGVTRRLWCNRYRPGYYASASSEAVGTSTLHLDEERYDAIVALAREKGIAASALIGAARIAAGLSADPIEVVEAERKLAAARAAA